MGADENAEKLRQAIAEQRRIDSERQAKLLDDQNKQEAAEEKRRQAVLKAAHEALGKEWPHK